MTNGDGEGRIFPFHPHTNNGFFFLLTIKYHIFTLNKKFSQAPEYAGMTSLRRNDDVTCFLRVTVRFLSFPRVRGYVR